MALTLLIDGTTPANAASLDQFLAVGTGGKHGVTAFFARIRYTGSVWQVVATTDSAGLVSSALTWNTDHLDVTLSTFATAPLPLVSPVRGATIYLPSVTAASNGVLGIEWRDYAGVLQTAQSTNMDCNLLVIGG